MQLILRENYPSLGYVGDVVTVKKGFARNFLIPRGIASEASSRSARMFKHILSGIEAKKNRLKAEAEEYAKELESLTLEYTLKVGSEGKSFGSITLKDVHKTLVEKEHALERKQLRLGEVIKSPGEYTVTVQLHSEVTAEVRIRVDGVTSSTKKGGARKEKVELDSSEGEKTEGAGADDDGSATDQNSESAVEVAPNDGADAEQESL